MRDGLWIVLTQAVYPILHVRKTSWLSSLVVYDNPELFHGVWDPHLDRFVDSFSHLPWSLHALIHKEYIVISFFFYKEDLNIRKIYYNTTAFRLSLEPRANSSYYVLPGALEWFCIPLVVKAYMARYRGSSSLHRIEANYCTHHHSECQAVC